MLTVNQTRSLCQSIFTVLLFCAWSSSWSRMFAFESLPGTSQGGNRQWIRRSSGRWTRSKIRRWWCDITMNKKILRVYECIVANEIIVDEICFLFFRTG